MIDLALNVRRREGRVASGEAQRGNLVLAASALRFPGFLEAGRPILTRCDDARAEPHVERESLLARLGRSGDRREGNESQNKRCEKVS